MFKNIEAKHCQISHRITAQVHIPITPGKCNFQWELRYSNNHNIYYDTLVFVGICRRKVDQLVLRRHFEFWWICATIYWVMVCLMCSSNKSWNCWLFDWLYLFWIFEYINQYLWLSKLAYIQYSDNFWLFGMHSQYIEMCESFVGYSILFDVLIKHRQMTEEQCQTAQKEWIEFEIP